MSFRVLRTVLKLAVTNVEVTVRAILALGQYFFVDNLSVVVHDLFLKLPNPRRTEKTEVLTGASERAPAEPDQYKCWDNADSLGVFERGRWSWWLSTK